MILLIISVPAWSQTTGLNWQTSTFQPGLAEVARPNAVPYFAGGPMPFPNVYAPANYQLMGSPAILPARYYVNGVFNPNPLPTANEPWAFDPRLGPPAIANYPVPLAPPVDTRPAVAAVVSFVSGLIKYCARCSIHTDTVTPIQEPAATPPPIEPPPHETEAGLSHVPQVAPAAGDHIADGGEEAPRPAQHEVARPVPAAAVSSARVPKPRPGIGPRVREKLKPHLVARRRAFTKEERSAQGAPMWKPFVKAFEACEPGCEPTDYAAYGDRGNVSCHPTGEAIDMHAFTCNGQLYRAIDYGPEFQKMLACMRTKVKHVLSHNKPWEGGRNITAGHYDHAHFSNGCVVNGRPVW